VTQGHDGVKTWHKWLDKDMRSFVVAMTVIVSFVIVFGLVTFYKDIETLKTVAAIWGVWIGAVIGYYFGSKPVESLMETIVALSQQRISDLESELKKHVEIRTNLETELKNKNRQIDQFESRLKTEEQVKNAAIGAIDWIVKTYGQQFDKDVNASLKTFIDKYGNIKKEV